MSSRKIAIFCSCAGYGTYIPSLLLQKELMQYGCNTRIYVFEDFFTAERKERFLAYRKQFHNSFRFAVMASNIAADTIQQEIVDYNLFENLLTSEKFDQYIVLYGAWVSIFEYMEMNPDSITCVRLDVVDTPSWRKVENADKKYETIWLLGRDGEKPKYKLYDEQKEIRNEANKIVLHGGGWGITNHVDVIEKIKAEYELHVIYSTKNECRGNNIEYYMPIEWMPNLENPEFPPLYKAVNDQKVDFRQLCRSCCALMSKPGGGSCLDAIQFQIPFIYLNGMAEHENENGKHLSALGFGIRFEEWMKEGCSMETIHNIQKNIFSEMQNVELLSKYFLKKLV